MQNKQFLIREISQGTGAVSTQEFYGSEAELVSEPSKHTERSCDDTEIHFLFADDKFIDKCIANIDDNTKNIIDEIQSDFELSDKLRQSYMDNLNNCKNKWVVCPLNECEMLCEIII